MEASLQHRGRDALPAAAVQSQGTSTPPVDRSASLHLPGSAERSALSTLPQAPESEDGGEVADLDENNDADSASTWSPEVLRLGGWVLHRYEV